jgi:hypothetical protein
MLFVSTQALQEFSWLDESPLPEVAQGVTPDIMIQVLPMCPHLRKVDIGTKCFSIDAMKNPLRLRSAIDLRLVLETEQ